jgi:hypothetical protein
LLHLVVTHYGVGNYLENQEDFVKRAWSFNLFALLSLALCLVFAPTGLAQSIVSGEISGTVTDASGAVVPNATVNLASTETGFNESTTTSAAGTFRFALVKPGNYTLSITAGGFSTVKRTVVASTGQVSEFPIQLEVGGKTETVEISAAAPLIQTQNGNLASTIDTATIERMPNSGQDMTNFALMTPGVTVSSGGGYGNFTANGQPGTANLYTVNGGDMNDPENGLNNSGASNMMLGANELQEVTVVTNGYTGEYGRAAGANVNMSTKSGSNQFHGNATYWWNGTILNANDWFNNSTNPVTPRGHAVSNQYAGSIGGPIKKDKLFFFFDYEGLRYVLPGGGQVFLPSTAFANGTLANLAANGQAAQVPFYTTVFNLYKGAPGSSGAAPVAAACGDLTGTAVPGGGVFDDATHPCATVFQSTVNSLNSERLLAATVDWNASPKDSVKFRYWQDRGVQATATDPINAAFNANSVQPQDAGQATWTHVFDSHVTNQLVVGGFYYSAVFGPPNLGASLAVFPTTLLFTDGAPFDNLGGGAQQGPGNSNFPQGRNVSQYQVIDDLAWTKGSHGIKFGVNFRGNRISSFASGGQTSGLVTINSLTEFYNGLATVSGFSQAFAKQTSYPTQYSSLGLYAQDEWSVSSHLKMTFALRIDRNTNLECTIGCYARPAGSFNQAAHNINTPYDQTILTGLKKAFPSLQSVVLGPRIGFAWTPRNDLVIRGGGGIFGQLYPGSFGDRFIQNAPNVTNFTAAANNGGTFPFAMGPKENPDGGQGVPGNLREQVTNSNATFQNLFFSGGTLLDMQTALPGFSLPNLNTVVGDTTNTKSYQWNLEVQKAFGASTVLSVIYVGNHGANIFVRNPWLNTYCNPTRVACNQAGTEFNALRKAPLDQRFGSVLEVQNNGISNYHGLSVSLVRRFSHGFSGTLNYNYSHSLDDVSNGGLYQYNLNNAANSFRIQLDPNSLRHINYGNSDYDFRHSLSANYVYDLPFKMGNHLVNDVIGGWSIAGTFFFKSGEPFSVYNTAARTRNLANSNGGGVLADFTGGSTTCSNSAVLCPLAGQFTYFGGTARNQPDFGTFSRNTFRGPYFFDTDFSIEKAIKVRENMTFTIGAAAYNVLNHPNFDNPHASVSTPATFGQSFQTVGPPNSPYGNFTGAIVNGRVMQLNAKFKF